MPTSAEWAGALRSPGGEARFSPLYLSNSEGKTERAVNALGCFESIFGARSNLRLFSSPGRCEISGNHTDHQHGRVLAAAMNIDILAVVSANNSGIIRIHSQGHGQSEVDTTLLNRLDDERGNTNSLIRGVTARMKELGYKTGGFDAYITSDVLVGSGLSSSAAFETLICTVLAELYNDGEPDPVKRAQISRYAENEYFGKPCGLMDQTACACGGFVAMDFSNPENQVVEKIPFNFAGSGFTLCVVNTGGSHAELTEDYASVPAEMSAVAEEFGKKFLREVDETLFYKRLPLLRGRLSDRAVLRAIHFFRDNERVHAQTEALREGNFDRFLRLVNESGRSSFMYLQNVYSTNDVNRQGLSVALAVAERVLGARGAFRVHGGGFAGTVQAFVPDDLLSGFTCAMESVFGAGSMLALYVREAGSIEIII